LIISAAGLGVLVLLTSLFWLRARHGRRVARRATAELGSELRTARISIDSLRIGEREAAWAATATAHRLDRNMIALGKADHEVDRLGADLDDLRTRLGAADRDLAGLRTDYDEASTRVAVLEGDLELAQRAAAETKEDLETLEDLKQRLAAAMTARDELSATVQQVPRLESELAALNQAHQDLQKELAQLHSQIDEPQGDAPPAPSPSEADSDRLIASEAARRDLESQLAGLTAARSAERKASGDRIASLERLHGRIGERDHRIVELEAELENASALDLDAPPATYAEWDRMMRTRIATSVATATYRLKDQVAHLRTVVAEKEGLLRGRRLIQPAKKRPLPVTAIKGIGPVIAGILANHGITSIEEIAALSDDDIDRLGASMPVYPDRIRGDNWVRQAQSLLA
jgi:predicted flap endonuclease-1-like 5' DNA nuclease